MCVFKPAGVACAGLWGPCGSAAAGLASEKCCVKVKRLGRRTGVGESPVTVSVALVCMVGPHTLIVMVSGRSASAPSS